MNANPTRERILAVTRALLRDGAGGSAITVGAVAAAAHVSRATLYRYFPDKATLLRSAGFGDGPLQSPTTPRERILAAFVEVVGERGIHAATLDEIAGRAGLSRSGLNWHYKNKDELVADFARSIQLLPRVEDEVVRAGAPDADIERQLTGFVSLLLAQAGRFQGVGRILLFESAFYPEVAEFASTYSIGRALPLLTQLFEQHAHSGSLRPGSAQVRAQAFLGMFMSLVLLRPAFARLLAPDDDATAREYIDILLHGILSPAQPE